MTDYVLVGLVKRRAELAGQIEATHAELRRMVDALENLDQTIRQFDPSHNVEGIRPKAFRPPQDWANRGQMSRLVLSILRQAAEPMTSRDIAVEMLVTRALDGEDQRLIRLMTKRVGVALRLQRDNGAVRALPGPGQFVLWGSGKVKRLDGSVRSLPGKATIVDLVRCTKRLLEDQLAYFHACPKPYRQRAMVNDFETDSTVKASMNCRSRYMNSQSNPP